MVPGSWRSCFAASGKNLNSRNRIRRKGSHIMFIRIIHFPCSLLNGISKTLALKKHKSRSESEINDTLVTLLELTVIHFDTGTNRKWTARSWGLGNNAKARSSSSVGALSHCHRAVQRDQNYQQKRCPPPHQDPCLGPSAHDVTQKHRNIPDQ